MTTKIWTFELEDGIHTLQLDHGYFSGKRTISLDGKVLDKRQKLFDTGSDHHFQIGKHTGTVHIGTNGLTFNYDLSLDGRSVTTGKEAAPTLQVPSWAWIFIVACAIIPFITLGGAIPAVIGFGGAVGCGSVSRDSTKDTTTRVLLCTLITGACWGVLLVFLVLIGSLAGG